MSTFRSPASESPRRQALRIGLIYLVVSVVWIYVSDEVVARLFSDPDVIRLAQTWKGWAFVGVSAALIVFLVRRELIRTREVGGGFRALVEQSLAGVYLIQRGRFRYVNPTLAEIFGYAPREIMEDLRVEELVAPEDRALVLRSVEARENGVEDELHYRFEGLRKDGRRVQVEVHGSRISWQGAPAVLGVLLDVGERQRLERQILEAQKMEALGKLTGQVAHDFNNFLTGIIGPLDLCRALLPPDHEACREVEEARQTAMRAASLSQKLLTFSRHSTAVPRRVAVNAAVEEVAPLLRRLVPPSVELRLELDDEAQVVSIDPSGLEQVLVNLVMNAGEAIEGRGSVIVRVRADGADRVRLEVEDDGTGMSETERAQIFQPFFTTKERGTGLGLSTVYGIVTQAGGSLDVESEPGSGTRLAIRLPRLPGEAPDRGRARAVSGAGPLEGSEAILVVEDEDAVRRTVVRALERAGYTVLDAGDGEAALRIFGEKTVDLLLSDIQLPDVPGPELATRMKELDPELRVVYMSGYSDREVTERLKDNRSVVLLQKPFSMDELLETVRRVLDGGADASGQEAV